METIGVLILRKKGKTVTIQPHKLSVEGIRLIKAYNIDDFDSNLEYVIIIKVDISKYPESLVEYVETLDQFWHVEVYHPVRAFNEKGEWSLMASKKEGYTNISIPNELADEIRKIVQSRKYGYSSVSEFVKEAVRIHLLQIKKIGAEG